MKNIILTLLTFSFMTFEANAQTDLNSLTEIKHKMAIKQVVDTFSILADTKEIDKQVLLFTEDGVVESKVNGQSTVLKGRQQLFQAFSGFLSNFHIVYHQNGQQTVELNGDRANSTSYCRVILIGKQNGKDVKTTFYVIYRDQFVNKEGKWLIAHRISNFVHTENEPIN